MTLSGTLARLARVERLWKAAAARHGASRLAVARAVAERALTLGFRPVEALQLGLGDPGLSPRVLGACLPKHRLMALQDRLNPIELVALTEDKAVFAEKAEGLGLPVPKTHAVVGRGAPGPLSVSRADFVARTAATLPSTFITKPALGVYGEAVERWARRDERFEDSQGALKSAAELFDHLSVHPKYERFLVQERLENHPEVFALTGVRALSTVRAATLLPRSGGALVGYAEWKVAATDGVVDNFKQGETGNLLANLRLRDGMLGPAKRPSPDGIGMRAVEAHPTTGKVFAGAVLPDWPALLDVARRFAEAFAPLRTVGWDIGLTPQGPRVVEGNRWWDPANDVMLGPQAPDVQEHELVAFIARLEAEAGA
ncbi:MAG: hypothetical protein K1X89_18185 [Myxococcaceae bacterium]|nr:hypothetical protein [Myxococcaceae bacterium]